MTLSSEFLQPVTMLHFCEQFAVCRIMQENSRLSVSLSVIGEPNYTVHTFNILLCIDLVFKVKIIMNGLTV